MRADRPADWTTVRLGFAEVQVTQLGTISDDTTGGLNEVKKGAMLGSLWIE